MNSKINIILDLDETLIHTTSIDEEKQLKEGPNQSNAGRLTSYKMYSEDGVKVVYIVYERPGLQNFLDYLFKYFNVSIWTAASKMYALFIVKNIVLKKPGRKLDWIFFDYHCTISKKATQNNKNIKCLRMLPVLFKIPYNMNNTIIIDDNPDVRTAQPGNCVHIKPFVVDEKNSDQDVELLKIMQYLKEMTPEPTNEKFLPAASINTKLKEKQIMVN